MSDLIFHAIADPRRRRILRLIRARELSSGEIASRFDVTPPAISQHLRVLERAGLVHVRRQGTRRLYRARPERLEEVRAFVDAFWAGGLERLKRAAEADQRRRDAAGKP